MSKTIEFNKANKPKVRLEIRPVPIDSETFSNETALETIRESIQPLRRGVPADRGKVVKLFDEDHFSLKVGNTTYEVNTHLNPDSKQSVFGLFKELLLSDKL